MNSRPPLKLTLIRHAHPDKSHTSDPPLSPIGRDQATTLSGHYPLVVISPLRRTLDTYIHSNIHGDRVVISDLLREQRDSSTYNYFRCEDIHPETKADVMERIKKLKFWLEEQPEREVCFITSAFLMCYFRESCHKTGPLIGYIQPMHLEL